MVRKKYNHGGYRPQSVDRWKNQYLKFGYDGIYKEASNVKNLKKLIPFLALVFVMAGCGVSEDERYI